MVQDAQHHPGDEVAAGLRDQVQGGDTERPDGGIKVNTGVYILQNTGVAEGGRIEWMLGEMLDENSGQEKVGNCIISGLKCIEHASFGLYFAPPIAAMFAWGKNGSQKGVG